LIIISSFPLASRMPESLVVEPISNQGRWLPDTTGHVGDPFCGNPADGTLFFPASCKNRDPKAKKDGYPEWALQMEAPADR
jgi:hypothetical protein